MVRSEIGTSHTGYDMIEMIAVHARKNPQIRTRLFTILLLFTVTLFQNAIAADTLILDNGEPGTSSIGKWRLSKRGNPYNNCGILN